VGVVVVVVVVAAAAAVKVRDSVRSLLPPNYLRFEVIDRD
jgi:hypothetical protein